MSIVTDLADSAVRSVPIDVAVAAAETAARTSGVTVRQLDGMDELHRVCVLYEQIWRFGANAPVTSELLRAMSKAGSYVAGAFDDDELVGACVGFFAPPDQEAMHSHIAGVSPRVRGRSVGFALKVHQRAWAMMRGVSEISWTYDPLVSRNAHFNLVKLGARPVEYLANFYGPMHDGLNGGDDTDRLLVGWRLDEPRVVVACDGAPRPLESVSGSVAEAPLALEMSDSGEPIARPTGRATTVRVVVPRDIEGLRSADPACAARWRASVREVLGGLLAGGARIRGFDHGNCYLVDTGDTS